MAAAPRRRPAARAPAGTLLIYAGLELMHVLTAYYFAGRLGTAPRLYGSLGIAATILAWLYVVARLIVAGGFLNATLWYRRHPRDDQTQANRTVGPDSARGCSGGGADDRVPGAGEVAVSPQVIEPQLDVPRKERRARAQRDRRDHHDDLVEEARVGELTGQVSPTDDPDVPAAGGRDHLRVNRGDVSRS